jgi:acyl dehydratase
VAVPGHRATAATRIAALVDDPGNVTVELLGTPHDRLVRAFALDVPAGGDNRIRYADDLTAGDRFDLGEFTVSEDDIIAFGERWDPLDFHTDPTLARASPLGVLCASGVHTQGIMQRLAARGLHRRIAIVAGRRMLGMRLRAPVTASMRLHGHTEVVSVQPRPDDRALVVVRSTLVSNDTMILEQTGELVVQRRPPRVTTRAHRHKPQAAPDSIRRRMPTSILWS